MNRAQRRHRDATVRAVARGRINSRSTSWARDDREWFQQRPHRSHRVRNRFPGEEFGSKDDPTLDRVAVRQIATGVRARSPFEIPASPCAEYVREAAATEHGASILFELASRGVGALRCAVIMALLEGQGTPSGSVQ
jgi:hypothetical protein